MASNRKQPKVKTVLNTDPVLGGYLEPGTLRIKVQSFNPARRVFPATMTPLRLHQRATQFTETRHNVSSGPAFSPDFSRYLATIPATESTARIRYHFQYWYTAPWVEAELRAHFPADVVDLFWDIRVNGASITEQLRLAGLTLRDYGRHERAMKRHCVDIFKEISRRPAA